MAAPSECRPYGSRVMRFSGGGAIGRVRHEVANQGVGVDLAAERFVHCVKTLKPSPPSARKLFIVTRYEEAGFTVAPPSLIVAGSTLLPTAAPAL